MQRSKLNLLSYLIKKYRLYIIFNRPEEISQAVLNLLKHCPDDSYIHRIDLANSIKILIKHLGKEKFKDTGDFLNKFLDEELIFGNMKFPSIYAKNTITNYWIEIIHNL